MKKIIATFISLFVFSMIQASPSDFSLSHGGNVILSNVELNEGTSFVASKEMPRKKRASRSGKRNRKVRK